MIEQCANPDCGEPIEFTGDPQTVDCPKCGMITFRLTWDMFETAEERATKNLHMYVDWWFTNREWVV
jgi:hypothetical protein